MRALMYVDFQLAKKQLRNGLLLAVLFAAMIMGSSLAGDPEAEFAQGIADLQSAIMLMVTLMTGMMLLFGVFGPDEAGGWPETRLSLPVTRREVVSARYALMVLVGALTAVFGAIASIVAGLICGAIVSEAAGGLMTPLMTAGIAVLAVVTLMLFFAIEMPIIFKSGITAARYSLMFFWLIPVVCLIGPVRSFLDGIAVRFSGVHDPLPLAIGYVVVVVVLYFVSLLISTGIYSKHEL